MLVSASITSATAPSSAFDALVFKHLRRARIQLRLALNRVDFAGTSLKQGWIDGETALGLVDEAGLLSFVLSSSS